MESSLKSTIKKWLGYFPAILMVAQLIDFIVVIHEFFEIKIHGLGEPVEIIISLLLTLWVLRRFLIEEFELSEFDSSILLSLFLLFNLNFLLKITIGEEALMEMAEILNLLPIVVLALIPFYMFLRGDIKKYLDVLVFAVIVVYPLSQLYTMVLKKFVAIAVSIYVIYIFYLMLRHRELRIREAIKKLLEFDEVAVHQIHRLGMKNKEFYFIYLLIWLFMISDVILFLPPKFFGLWGHTHYHELIGVEAHESEITVPFIASASFFILIISYPIIEGFISKIKLLTPVFAMFLAYPVIAFSPITESGVYGVVMEVKNLVNVPFLIVATPVITFVIVILALVFSRQKFGTEVNLFNRSILLGISSAYLIVFLYSLYYQGILTHFSSPNTILLIFLTGFFTFSIVYLPYLSLKEIKNVSINFPAEILFLLVLALLFSYVPTIYTTLSFGIFSTLFLLREIRIERVLFLLYILSLMFNYHIAFALLFLIYGIATDIRNFPWRFLSPYALIPLFAIISLLVGEVIPFGLTLTGLTFLIILSGSEEVIFKRFLFDKMNERIGKLAVPIAFCFIHILSVNMLNYYIGTMMLPFFLAYIFSYQYVTVRMYEKNRNLIPFIIVHSCINVASLALGNLI